MIAFCVSAEQKKPACEFGAMRTVVGCTYIMRTGYITWERCPADAHERLPKVSVKSVQMDISNIASYIVSTPEGDYQVQIDESDAKNSCVVKNFIKL